MADANNSKARYKQRSHDTQAGSHDPTHILRQDGYQRSVPRTVLFGFLAAAPLGLGLLLAYWFPHVWLRATSFRVPLSRASHVLVKDEDGKLCVARVHMLAQLESGRGLAQLRGGAPAINEADERAILLPDAHTRYFIHRHLRYVYSEAEDRFLLLTRDSGGIHSSDVHHMICGLTRAEHRDRLLLYGANSIDVPVTPYYKLFVDEVLHPFYLFQILSVIFWMLNVYYYYACAVFLISTISLLVSLVQTRRNMQQLHDMVKASCTVTVLRSGAEVGGVASEALVPGDVLVIPPTGMDMPCDSALLTGSAIVNEAMLTGESVPVTKTPLPQDHTPYLPDSAKKHTLFGGTRVIQTRFYGNTKVLAVVVCTGFSTSKGSMVRSILFPKPLNVKFYSDALKFVLVLAVIAGLGFVYTIVYNLLKHYQLKETLLRAFDVITIVVPPALPAALTVGTVYALSRLRRQKIYCISPQRVNLCGKIKLVCFDKTGTLTEDSLDLAGVLPSHAASFGSFVEDASRLEHRPLLFAMATCHSLTNIDSQLSGDPLDIKMFQGTLWSLEEPECGGEHSQFDVLAPTVVRPPPSHPSHPSHPPPSTCLELGILRQFTFSSDLQRMSVLVRVLPNFDPKLLHVYVKGAPETIVKLCTPESVPKSFYSELGVLTQQGLRVLAVAHRTLHMPWHKAERVRRSVVESELTFAGLIVMQNKLKPQTTPTIQTLTAAAIRTVMVTGDNLLTAVSVARECSMIPSGHRVIEVKATPQQQVTFDLLGSAPQETAVEEEKCNDKDENGQDGSTPLLCYHDSTRGPRPFHLVVDGPSFAVIHEHLRAQLLPRLLVCGTVFARMSPDQKAQLVTELQAIGYGVAMCGDGANDCGALKSAHAGISLSDTEASVASPFTSKTPDITCVPAVIKEGRAALVTSFSVFKFMALYSLAEFISAAMLYAFESNLGDLQYLYIDLVLILAFAFVMGFTGPYPRLVKRRPPGSLAGVHVLLSLLVQVVLLVVFQVGALLYLQAQRWYRPLVPDPEGENIICSENTVIFTIANFQYVGLAVALSTAAPFRKPLFTNWLFVLCLLVLVPCNLYLTLAPAHWWPAFWRWIQLAPPPSFIFRLGVVELGLLYCAVAYFLEGYVFPTQCLRKLLRVLRCKRKPRNRYKHILAAIPPHWPSLSPQS